MQALMSVWVSFVMLFVNFVPGFVAPETDALPQKTYPYIFVHGFMGWGEDEGIDQDLSYWGATACDLIKNINEAGYECYDASVGPLSSNWDRACELYAQLTGTTVDYGAAHAAAHDHSRYGRTYDKPIVEGWGEKDENGLINKINLIGHSFGGNTIRLLQTLLAKGSEAERTASPDDVSPLFVGGKVDYINSLVTVCSPNNGTTLYYIADQLNIAMLLTICAYTYAGVMGRSPLNGYVDFHLEQFGLTYVPGEQPTEKHILDAMFVMLQHWEDTAMYDLSPDGVKELNDMSDLDPHTYYFSYAFDSSKKSSFADFYYPLPSTFAILQPFSLMIGSYDKNGISDYPIDETWLPNDGLVNVVSALYPHDDAHKDYDANNVEAGIWNVMPTSIGDHGNAIGIGVSEEITMEFYLNMIEMIEKLPVTN
ncbi:MAG: lipase [Clostridia bacterium]|nr:lipase [Clostridia bacterium]